MKKKFTTSLVMSMIIAGIVTVSSVSAQQTLYFDSIQNQCLSTSPVKLSLRTKNFNGILAAQGTISWDPTVLEYTGITYVNQTINFNGDMGFQDTAKGMLSYLWFQPATVPVSVPDTSILVTLQFSILKTIIGQTPISFSSALTNQEIDTADMTGFPWASNNTAYYNGFVGFVSQPTISRNGAILTAIPSGTPSSFQWNVGGSPLSGDTSISVYDSIAGGSYTVTVNYSDGCSSTSAPVLPVVLKQFNGFYKNGAADLSWSTASELNVSHFNVQRSLDGKDFSTVGEVNAVDNASGSSYSYKDATGNATGKLYYRLLVSDKSGAYTYSNIVAIALESQLSLSTYPNPVKNNLSLQLQNSRTENVTVQVIDMLGKVVNQQTVQLNAGINNVSLDVSSLAKGSYTVVVKGESTQYQKFIKL